VGESDITSTVLDLQDWIFALDFIQLPLALWKYQNLTYRFLRPDSGRGVHLRALRLFLSLVLATFLSLETALGLYPFPLFLFFLYIVF
jgi:hypothetical protein